MLSNVGFNPFVQSKTQKNEKTLNSKPYFSFKTLSKDTISFTANKTNEETKSKPPEIVQKLHDYIEKLKTQIKGNIIVVSGPSGVGKDTVINLMREKQPDLQSVLSLTTRAPRPGEVDGVNYKFLKGADKYEYFKGLIKDNKLFQYMHSKDNGQYYGVTKEDLEQKRIGHDVILNVTADEALRIKRENGDKAVTVFIDASSPEELEARLRARGTEKPEEVEKRLESGRKQRELSPDFDKIVINAKGKQDEAAEVMSEYIEERKDPTLKMLEDLEHSLEEKYDFNEEKSQVA